MILLFGGIYFCKMDLLELVELVGQDLLEQIDFNFYVKLILLDKCYFCYGFDFINQKVGFSLYIEEEVFSLLENFGKRVIVLGKFGSSELVYWIFLY